METPNTTYISTNKAASLLHLSSQRVRTLLGEGRIEGAFKDGLRWKIPLINGMPKVSCKEKGPEGSWRKREQKIMSFIHVNQHEIRSNCKNNTENPVILVKRGGTTNICNEVKIPGFGRIIYNPEKSKDCGAKVWFEIEPHIELQMNKFA